MHKNSARTTPVLTTTLYHLHTHTHTHIHPFTIWRNLFYRQNNTPCKIVASMRHACKILISKRQDQINVAMGNNTHIHIDGCIVADKGCTSLNRYRSEATTSYTLSTFLSFFFVHSPKQGLHSEVYPHSTDERWAERVVAVARHEGRFSDSRISDHQYFKHVVKVGIHVCIHRVLRRQPTHCCVTSRRNRRAVYTTKRSYRKGYYNF